MLMKGSTLISVSQPFALLWAFLTSLGSSKKLTFYAEWKTWHGLHAALPCASHLARMFIWSQRKPGWGNGWVQMVTVVEPRDLICAYDYVGVTQDTGCLLPHFLRVHSCRWEKSHVFLRWFPGYESVNCAFWL